MSSFEAFPCFPSSESRSSPASARLATRRRYPKDTVVFFENEEGDFFFTIVQGRIKVTILGDDGREIILSVLGPGDFFGEMALLDNEPRSATAIAVEDSGAPVGAPDGLPGRDRGQPRDQRRPHPDPHRPAAAGQPPDPTLALLDVYGRVARVILDMAKEEGRRLKDGRIAFRRATHQEIANRIGTTRETVTRMLKDLERQSLIRIEGKEIVLQPGFEKVFD